MPRRRALTEAQLEAMLALPADENHLIRHWTLDGADRIAVERRRGGHNQLGFALQLCAFRYPGRLLRPGEAIPEQALRFVAEQLRIEPGTLAAYAARSQTGREQLDALREEFGFRMFGPGHGRDLLAWLLPVALATTNAPAIAAALMDELRRRRIVAPGPSVVERLIAAVLVVAERHVADQLTKSNWLPTRAPRMSAPIFRASSTRSTTRSDYIPPWAISAQPSSRTNTPSKLSKQPLEMSTPRGAVHTQAEFLLEYDTRVIRHTARSAAATPA